MELFGIMEQFEKEISLANTSKEIHDVSVNYLGKKGIITNLLKDIKDFSKDERAKNAKQINILKSDMQALISKRKEEIKDEELNTKLESERIDVTLPGLFVSNGIIHPLTKMRLRVETFFKTMGYDILNGPEVELDYYNFEMLNFPKNHPAREMQDTFFIDEIHLLRTHTSPMQVRTMQGNEAKGPLRIISSGKVFRRDEDDATHSHQFMQLEGLLIDRDISIAHLIGTLQELARFIFGADRNIRVRPSYFPFTEPSMEVDVDCFNCSGAGCNICKKTGWIEILGAGMVHPNVLKSSGYDPEEYSGFAFGLGIERITMLKYGITNIRDFYINDIRFISKTSCKDGGMI